MAKFATLVSAFALLLVAAAATRSLVTTVEVDDEVSNQQWGGEGRCRQQIQMMGGLNQCRMFLMDQARCTGGSGRQWGSRGSRCQYGECDNAQFGLRRGTGAACPSMNFEPCCEQLRQLNQQCRCEGLREVMMRQQRGPFSGGEEMEEVSMVASNLPQMCGIGPQFCQISRHYLD